MWKISDEMVQDSVSKQRPNDLLDVDYLPTRCRWCNIIHSANISSCQRSRGQPKWPKNWPNSPKTRPILHERVETSSKSCSQSLRPEESQEDKNKNKKKKSETAGGAELEKTKKPIGLWLERRRWRRLQRPMHLSSISTIYFLFIGGGGRGQRCQSAVNSEKVHSSEPPPPSDYIHHIHHIHHLPFILKSALLSSILTWRLFSCRQS